MYRLLFLRKKFVLQVLLLVALNSLSLAQSTDYSDEDLKFSFYYDKGLLSNIQPRGWKGFAESYDEVNTLVSPLTKFKIVSMYDLGGRLRFDKIFVEVGFQHFEKTCNATFDFGEQRIFNIKNNSFVLGFGRSVMSIFNNRLKLFLYGDFRAGGPLIIQSGYKYRDGITSYGGELSLNGSYNGIAVMGSEWGTLLRFRVFKGLMLETKLAYQFNNNALNTSFDDISFYKALNASNTVGTLTFPADCRNYDPANAGNYPELKSAHNGYKFNIGIGYEF